MRITRIFSLLVTLTILAWSSLAHSSCVTSVWTGICPTSGAYAASSYITESNGYNTYVDNGVTGGYGVTPETQTLTSNSGSSWSVSADFGSSTHQLAYPVTDQGYNNEAVSSFTNIVATVNETTPHNSSTGEIAGFLIMLSGSQQVQIEHDMVNMSQCAGTTPVKTSIQFGGLYGVPTNSWDLCYTGSMYYWQLVKGGGSSWGFSSGSVDLAAMLMYLENNGYLSSGTTISRVRYGFMIYTTSSTQETFSLNSYTLLNNVAGSPTISLSPTSLSFSATAGGGNPSAKNVTVSNSGSGTLASPTTQINYSQGSGWLSVNCTGSSAPYTCSTQPTTGSLAAGTYTATVNVSSTGATNSPQPYTVTFTVSSGSVCTITTATGTCGPYSDTSISLTYQSQTQNDVWSPPSSWSQTLYTTNPGSWYAVANFPADPSGAVHTYPSMTIQYCCSGSQNPTLDSYSYMYSSFSTTPDTASTTVTDAGYDNWMNNWANEVMFQTQLINDSRCTDYFLHTVASSVSFGGTNGIPVNTWNLCQSANYPGTVELVWQLTDPSDSKNFGISSGGVDIYAMLKWLENSTACYSSSGPGTACLPAGSTFTQTTYGWEITGTGSLSKTFTVNSLTFTASH